MTHCDVFRKQRVDRFAPRSLDTIALKQHKPAERAISAKRHSAKRVQHQSMEYATRVHDCGMCDSRRHRARRDTATVIPTHTRRQPLPPSRTASWFSAVQGALTVTRRILIAELNVVKRRIADSEVLAGASPPIIPQVVCRDLIDSDVGAVPDRKTRAAEPTICAEPVAVWVDHQVGAVAGLGVADFDITDGLARRESTSQWSFLGTNAGLKHRTHHMRAVPERQQSVVRPAQQRQPVTAGHSCTREDLPRRTISSGDQDRAGGDAVELLHRLWAQDAAAAEGERARGGATTLLDEDGRVRQRGDATGRRAADANGGRACQARQQRGEEEGAVARCRHRAGRHMNQKLAPRNSSRSWLHVCGQVRRV